MPERSRAILEDHALIFVLCVSVRSMTKPGLRIDEKFLLPFFSQGVPLCHCLNFMSQSNFAVFAMVRVLAAMCLVGVLFYHLLPVSM